MNNNNCKSCAKEPVNQVNVGRFIQKLEEYFSTNDTEGAGRHIEYWENEARNFNDTRGLLSILNEELGYYRRVNDKEKAIAAVEEAVRVLSENGLADSVSGATIYINAATTLKAFGLAQKGMTYFDIAQRTYKANGKDKDFDYAALLNNKASALCDLKLYDEAELCYNRAVEILKEIGKHDGEIAVSLINLAHLYFDRDSTAYRQVEEYLDSAWEYLNSPGIARNGSYAFILSKCIPSYRYFKRELEAEALEEVTKEIYGGK